MKRAVFSRAIACISIMTILSASCGKDNGTGPGNDTVDDWKTGSAVTYPVSGNEMVQVTDSVSGCTFVVAPGGDAELKITPVESGPELPMTAQMFQVDYTGDGPVTIKVPHVGDDTDILFSYSTLDNAAIDDMDGNVGWWGMDPIGEEDGASVYELTLDEPVATKPAKYAPPSSSTFAVATITAGSTDAQKMAAVRATVTQCIDTWLNTLPASVATTARTQVTNLPWVISWSSSGNAYQHQNSMIFANAKFFLSINAGIESVAHEVGHYMTHAMLGYDRYSEIYNRFPTDFWGSAVRHDVGDYRVGRKEILEDYPYISELMINGNVSNYDLTSVSKYNHVRDMVSNAQPSVKDYPSHEGYGAVILASLLRQEKEVYSFTKDAGQEKAKAPVIGAPMSDILGILARGPRDVNEVRRFIQDYLDTRSNDDKYKLPAMLEPLGWSYNGSGTLKKDDGDPATGITVQNIYQDGNTEYSTPSVHTGIDGKFTLPRIYPGQSLLRVFYNAGKDSTDFPLTAEWEKPTNEPLTLGEFQIPEQDKTIDVSFTGHYALTPGIRAQNQLTVQCTGTLDVAESMYPMLYTNGNWVEVQTSANLYQNLKLNLTINHTLANGTEWVTSLSEGDVPNAVKARTELSNPRIRINEVYGPNDVEKNERSVGVSSLSMIARPATKNYQYYRADARLEWDFTQTYYDKDGASIAAESGTTGVNIVHIWRDVSVWEW